MDLIYDYGFFLAKTITVLVAVLIIISAIFSQKGKKTDGLDTDCLNELHKDQKQKIIKKFKWKHIKKDKKLDLNQLPKLFVLDFNGDMKASQTQQLREEITNIIQLAQAGDEVMLKLESPGGVVNGYGLAAAQLERLRNHSIPLTVCIDQVAASGGYLMACIANRIISAPFAIIGSIGVVAQMPNFNKWLKKHNIDFEQITAGDYKRTLTMFGENTEAGRKKFSEDLQLIHENFKNHVLNYRPQLDMKKVGTGEHWLARDAMQLGLVDELKTSDDFILEKLNHFQMISISQVKVQSLVEKIIKPTGNVLSQIPQMIKRITV
ncbi:MAG TPA: protease SohB [Legionellales bacterium]|nr:protease SohB [Legionellales bacterium]